MLDNLRSLEELGISRLQVTEMVKGSLDEIAGVLR